MNAAQADAAQKRAPPEAIDRKYRLVVFAVPADREALQRALRRHLGLNPVDARIAAHNVPGMLPQPLSETEAAAAAAAVSGLGVEAQGLPADEWPALGHTPHVHHVRCAPEGLEVVPLSGQGAQTTAWELVSLISIAEVPLDAGRHSIPARTAVIRATPRIKGGELETRTLHGAEIWIICESPFRALRFDHREMNYEYLGERRGGSAAANFVLFAKELVERSARAWLTSTTRAFLNRRPAEEYRLDSMERHRRLVELNTVLMRRARTVRGASDGAPSPQE